MKHILILFCSLHVIQSVTTLKLKCDNVKSNIKTTFGMIKVCYITTDIISTTPNLKVEIIEAKEDLKNVKAFVVNHQSIIKSSLHYLPKGIEKFLPNLKLILFGYCGLKSLTKDDLKPFSQLHGLFINNSNLTALQGNLFNYSTKLEELIFNNNPIQYVEPDTFKPLTSLVDLRFVENACYSYNEKIAPDDFEREFKNIEDNCNEKPLAKDPSMKINIKCENIKMANGNLFGRMKECQVNYDLNVTRRGVVVESVKCEEDLKTIQSLVIGYAKNFHYIPFGIAQKFPRLKRLTVGDSGLKELRNQEMLQFKDLIGLCIINTKLQFVEGNVFDNIRILKELVIKGHRMKYVEAGIFDILNQINLFMFHDNQCYDRSLKKVIAVTERLSYLEIYKRCKKKEGDDYTKVLLKKLQ